MIGNLNHVAIAVSNLADASKTYNQSLGAKISAPQALPEHGVTVVFVELPNSKVELLEPLGDYDFTVGGYGEVFAVIITSAISRVIVEYVTDNGAATLGFFLLSGTVIGVFYLAYKYYRHVIVNFEGTL